VVIRELYSDLCSPYIIGDAPERLNAFVIQRLEKTEWLNRDIFVCSLSIPKKHKVPAQVIPGTAGEVVDETVPEAYEVNGYYKVKRVYQDDRCGTGSEANAYIVQFEEQ
jgi:hypothetical protein